MSSVFCKTIYVNYSKDAHHVPDEKDRPGFEYVKNKFYNDKYKKDDRFSIIQS